MHFFLQGPQRSGKSTLLRKHLMGFQRILCGFTVQRLLEKEETAGFRVEVIRGQLPPVDAVFSWEYEGIFFSPDGYMPGQLERAVAEVECICQSPWCQLILLDEIGGVELGSPGFMQSLQAILTCGKPCVGVFKSTDNLHHMIEQRELPSGYLDLHKELQQELCSLGKLLTLWEDSQIDVEEQFKQFLYQLGTEELYGSLQSNQGFGVFSEYLGV